MIKKCLGCGIKLQSNDKEKNGYITDLNKNICERCFKLSNYGDYKKVELSNDDFMKIINSINDEDLVIYVSSLLDLNMQYIENFKNVLLVLTKRDILPKSVKDNKIIDYITKKYKNILDINIISSIHNYNVDDVYNNILKYKKNKNVYIVGYTNSGKSTLINKLIKNYTNNKALVTTSIFPSTTLDKIVINFKNFNIIDTPGLICEKSITNNYDKIDLKKINCKKEIKPKSVQIKEKGSILIDKYIRIDYETEKKNSLVFYMSNNLQIKFNNINNNILKDGVHKNIKLGNNKDIVFRELGFIKIVNPIKIKIYMYKEIEIIIRDNLI